MRAESGLVQWVTLSLAPQGAEFIHQGSVSLLSISICSTHYAHRLGAGNFLIEFVRQGGVFRCCSTFESVNLQSV